MCPICLICLLALLCSCADSDVFRVSGTVTPEGTYGLRVYYHSGQAVKYIPAAASKGRFAFEGHSRQPVIVDILGTDGRMLSQFVAQDGQHLEARLNINDPYQSRVTGGDDVNDRWSQWLRDNARTLHQGDSRAINTAVEAYAARHTDDLLSACLLVTQYDWSLNPSEGLRLLQALHPDARPQSIVQGITLLSQGMLPPAKGKRLGTLRYHDLRDSLTTWNPSGHGPTLIVLTGHQGSVPDSILTALRSWPNASNVLELCLDADTVSWRSAVSADDAHWRRGWLPGGTQARGLEHLGIPVLPYCLVADTLGRITAATPSITAALQALQ